MLMTESTMMKVCRPLKLFQILASWLGVPFQITPMVNTQIKSNTRRMMLSRNSWAEGERGGLRGSWFCWDCPLALLFAACRSREGRKRSSNLVFLSNWSKLVPIRKVSLAHLQNPCPLSLTYRNSEIQNLSDMREQVSCRRGHCLKF